MFGSNPKQGFFKKLFFNFFFCFKQQKHMQGPGKKSTASSDIVLFVLRVTHEVIPAQGFSHFLSCFRNCVAKYCTRKAKGPFLLLARDLSEPFDRENWECFLNLHPEGMICPFFKEKKPTLQLLCGWCLALAPWQILELFSHLSDPAVPCSVQRFHLLIQGFVWSLSSSTEILTVLLEIGGFWGEILWIEGIWVF